MSSSRRFASPSVSLFLFLLLLLAACGGNDTKPAPVDGDTDGEATVDGDEAVDGDGVDGDAATDGDGEETDAERTDGEEVEFGDGEEDAAEIEAETESEAETPVLRVMSIEELYDALPNKGFLLINVHVPREGEIPGTDVHISYQKLDELAAYIGGDLGRKTVLYCKTNFMSTYAGERLVQRGYSQLYYLDGGMNGWEAAGYTLDAR